MEAAVVLPLFFLTIFSLILLMSYCFTCLRSQVELHTELASETMTSTSLFRLERQTRSVHQPITGILSEEFGKTITAESYHISEADLHRIGKEILP